MNAGIYIRKSREDKDPEKEAHRLVLQRESLPAYARAQGWAPIIYDDGYASAGKGNLANLKERTRLETDIRAGRINVVLVLEFSRISRDDSMEDYARFIGLCRDFSVKLATPSQTIDPNNTNEWLLSVLTGTLSAAEMQVLKRRMAEGRAEAKRKGKYLGGIPPAPYRLAGAGKLIIDSGELKQLQKIWSLSETMSAKEVAARLSIPLITVRRAISDDRLLFYQALRKGEDETLIQCNWPTCMDAEQAGRITTARKSRYAVPGPLIRRGGGLLTGLNIFKCGYCGLSIHSMKNGRRDETGNRRNEYYGCRAKATANACAQSRMVRQQEIDRRVITNILGTLDRIEQLKAYWSAIQSTAPDTQTAGLAKEELALMAQKKRLVAAIAEGIISFVDARETREQIEAQLHRIVARRKELSAPKQYEPDWGKLTATANVLRGEDTAKKRKAISTIISHIRMFDTYLLLEYRFPRKINGTKTVRIHLPSPLKPGPKKRLDSSPET